MEMRQLLRSGASFVLSDEDRVWLDAPPVGLEWPNCEISGALHPPPGSHSWLDYAVEHLDTRELNHMSLFDASIWGGEVSMETFLEAVRNELQTLRKLAGERRQQIDSADRRFQVGKNASVS